MTGFTTILLLPCELFTPDENASAHTFNKHVIKHRFCPTCGMHPDGEAVDLERIPVTNYDGRAI